MVCGMPFAISLFLHRTIARLVDEERALGLTVERGDE